MTDSPSGLRLNPEAEALIGYVSAVDVFTNSMVKLAHIVASKDIDEDMKAEVKAVHSAITKRFINEIETTLTAAVGKEKRGQLIWPTSGGVN